MQDAINQTAAYSRTILLLPKHLYSSSPPLVRYRGASSLQTNFHFRWLPVETERQALIPYTYKVIYIYTQIAAYNCWLVVFFCAHQPANLCFQIMNIFRPINFYSDKHNCELYRAPSWSFGKIFLLWTAKQDWHLKSKWMETSSFFGFKDLLLFLFGTIKTHLYDQPVVAASLLFWSRPPATNVNKLTEKFKCPSIVINIIRTRADRLPKSAATLWSGAYGENFSGPNVA